MKKYLSIKDRNKQAWIYYTTLVEGGLQKTKARLLTREKFGLKSDQSFYYLKKQVLSYNN